jgi:5-methylcytosine-specific restriction endonuclease McrA
MPSDFHKRFASIYAGMKRRTDEKRFKTGRNTGRIRRHAVPLGFTAKDLEAWLLARRGAPDKPYQCRYCSGWITLMTCVLDHAVPLHRGGSAGLSNLDDPCPSCNAEKGRLTPEEFVWFRERMLEMEFKFGRVPVSDITSRMGKAVRLAASVWRSQGQKAKQAVATQQVEADF